MKWKWKQATDRVKKIICSLSLHEMGPSFFWSKLGISGLIGCRFQVSWHHHIYDLQKLRHERHLCRSRGPLSHPGKKKTGRYLARRCWTFGPSTVNNHQTIIIWVVGFFVSCGVPDTASEQYRFSVCLSPSRTMVLSICLSASLSMSLSQSYVYMCVF